jgi:hypothetical protein
MNNEEKGTWQKRYRYANLWHFRCSNCSMTCAQSSREQPTYAYCPHCAKPMQITNEDNK